MSQDWKPIIFNKSTSDTKNAKDGKEKKIDINNDSKSGVEKRFKIGNKKNKPDGSKIESEDYKIPSVSRSLSVQIMNARCDKKMTQKDLANKVNEKVDIIKNYENGTAIPNSQQMNKMSKILGVTLSNKNK